jgi:hypothetical protein
MTLKFISLKPKSSDRRHFLSPGCSQRIRDVKRRDNSVGEEKEEDKKEEEEKEQH